MSLRTCIIAEFLQPVSNFTREGAGVFTLIITDEPMLKHELASLGQTEELLKLTH